MKLSKRDGTITASFIGSVPKWNSFTIPTGETSLVVTHNAGFTPKAVVISKNDVYGITARVTAKTTTTFTVEIDQQGGDATFDYGLGK